MPINKHRERKGGRQRIKSCTHTHTHSCQIFFWIIGLYLYINTNSKKFGNFVKKHRGEEGGEREETHTYIYSYT